MSKSEKNAQNRSGELVQNRFAVLQRSSFRFLFFQEKEETKNNTISHFAVDENAKYAQI